MKSLVLGTIASVSFVTIWKMHNSLTEFAEIGPYPVAEQYCFKRMLQRLIVDKTKVDLSQSWFPLNSYLFDEQKRITDNGHPISGVARDNARNLIDSAITAGGFKKFEINPSTSSSRSEGGVMHPHYATNDLFQHYAMKTPSVGSVVVGVDVDYYLRDLSYVLGFGNPAIFHTFQPMHVAGVDGDARYRIVGNRVQYDVSGGNRWDHEIWDWLAFGEFIDVPARTTFSSEPFSWLLGKLFGLEKTYHYKIHHARPWKNCRSRALVWLIPQVSYWRIRGFPNEVNARRLKRVKFSMDSKPGWNSCVTQDKDAELMISFGREGEDYSMCIEKSAYDVVMALNNSQSVSARLLQLGITDGLQLAFMTQHHAGKQQQIIEHPRFGRSIQPLVHWPSAIEADEREISSRAYSNPLVTDENLMPMIKRWEVLSSSLDQRVTFVKNSKQPKQRIAQYANEFVALVVPDANVGVPYDLEDVVIMLDKPSQVLAIKQIWETNDMRVRKLIEAFVKNEATNKDGRIISAFPDARFLLKFSSFTLAFRDHVLHAEHNKHWFCPGGTPNDIAKKVVDYVRSVEEPLEGDFSNFDGTVSVWCQRHVMNAVYMRWFGENYMRDLQGYTSMLISCPARAKRFGFKYDAGCGVKSGSPTTCDLNTVLNGFMQYAAVRMTLPELTKDEAFRSIGLAFGDDSLFEQRFQKSFGKVAEDLGMSLKLERYKPEQGLTFLARVYPDPYKTMTTFQDPLRTWRKLHLTSRDPNVPLGSAALDRVEGYLVTDSLSPLTSNYCRFIVRNYAEISESVVERSVRKSHNVEKPYWLTTGGAWPQNIEDVELMLSVTANRTGISVEDLRLMQDKIDKSNDVWSSPILNRAEEEIPYKNTLDPIDGLPVEDVDPRINENVRKTINLRASGNAASKSGVPNKNNRGPPRKVGGHADVSGMRREWHGERIKCGDGEGGTSCKVTNVKTNDPTVLQRGRGRTTSATRRVNGEDKSSSQRARRDPRSSKGVRSSNKSE
nr:MAG: RNA-dependent RNA polymerase [Sichuan mountain noda-like virus 2]